MKTLLLVVMLLLASSIVLAQDDVLSGTPAEICEAATPADEPETREYEEPEQVLESGVDYQAIFCTESGPVYIDLFEDQTPVTVNSFVFLAQNDYFNNTTFHRNINQPDGNPFMVQGGDPTATGSGGPGYQFQDEFRSYLTFDRVGLLAMANAGANTNGSQFFITKSITDYLNFAHTIFGEVISGYDNVEALPLRDPQADTEPGPALNAVVIITDPSTVDAEVESVEAVTSEDMQTVLDELPELPGVELVESTVETEFDDAAPDDLEYQVTVSHENTACDLETAPFESISYEIYAFADSEAAAAVLGDEAFLNTLYNVDEAEALETNTLPTPIYTTDVESCDEAGTLAVNVVQNGRLITVASSSLPNVDGTLPIDVWIAQVVRSNVYETLFAEPVLNPILDPDDPAFHEIRIRVCGKISLKFLDRSHRQARAAQQADMGYVIVAVDQGSC